MRMREFASRTVVRLSTVLSVCTRSASRFPSASWMLNVLTVAFRSTDVMFSLSVTPRMQPRLVFCPPCSPAKRPASCGSTGSNTTPVTRLPGLLDGGAWAHGWCGKRGEEAC